MREQEQQKTQSDLKFDPNICNRTTEEKISYLLERLLEIDKRLSVKTDITHTSFWTRALAVYGHVLAIQLIVSAVLFGIIVLVSAAR